jgi:hypothetical protein
VGHCRNRVDAGFSVDRLRTAARDDFGESRAGRAAGRARVSKIVHCDRLRPPHRHARLAAGSESARSARNAALLRLAGLAAGMLDSDSANVYRASRALGRLDQAALRAPKVALIASRGSRSLPRYTAICVASSGASCSTWPTCRHAAEAASAGSRAISWKRLASSSRAWRPRPTRASRAGGVSCVAAWRWRVHARCRPF